MSRFMQEANSLTLYGRLLLEKLLVSQSVNKFP